MNRLVSNHQLYIRPLGVRAKSIYRGKKQKDFSNVIYEDKNVPNVEQTDFEPNEFLPRRLTYMPPGLPQHAGPKYKPWKVQSPKKDYFIPPPSEISEFTEKPEYPQIQDTRTGCLRHWGELKQERLNWYQHIRDLPSFEQKQWEIMNTMALPTVSLSSVENLYDYLPLYSYLTRTHSIAESAITSQDSNLEELSKQLLPHLLDTIKAVLDTEQTIPFNEKKIRRIRKEHRAELLQSENIIQAVNSLLTRFTAQHNTSLLNDILVETNADIRSWWYSDALPPAKNIPAFKYWKFDKHNMPIQYKDYVPTNVRCSKPLKPIVNSNDELCSTSIPVFPTNPFKLGFVFKWLLVQQLPGFFPRLTESSKNENSNDLPSKEVLHDFPFVSFLNRGLLSVRDKLVGGGFNDHNDASKAMAIMHNFAYLNALAGVHGFTPYDEITYPLTNQCVVTDGQFWSFHTYQLNTHSFHNDVKKENKSNLCWSTDEFKLYEKYENGEFHGVNEEVVKHLLKMYMNKPQELSEMNTELRPYLGVDNRSLKEKEELRNDLRRRYGQVTSTSEKAFIAKRRVYPFEWIYFRNKLIPKRAERLPIKPRYKWPQNQIILGIQNAETDVRIDIGL